MAVTMKDVRAALDPEEPDYDKAAELGPDALPHLQELVSSADAMLASKATYLASMIADDRAVDVVETAARSSEPIVRVAAAAAVGNLAAVPAEGVLRDLAADADPGVRKVARGRGGIDERPGQPRAGRAPAGSGLMPGEEPGPAGPSGGRMPGEGGGDAAGGGMPGGGGMADGGGDAPREGGKAKRAPKKGEMPG